MTLDSEGIVTSWTAAAQRLFGYQAGAIVGKPVSVLFTDADRTRGELALELRDAHERGTAERRTWRVRADSSLFLSDEVTMALTGADGAVTGYCRLVRDASNRHNAVRAEHLPSARAESAGINEETLGMIWHELRTPLTSILGWTQVMRVQAAAARSPVVALDVIERNARTQARLIDDLLDASSIATGKVRLTLTPLRIVEPLTMAIETMRPIANERFVALQLELAVGEALVSGDSERLQQIVCNLVGNAIKFSYSGMTVTIAASVTHQHVILSVADAGTGIEPDFLPNAFEPFRQAEAGRSRQQPGLGLGLATVRHLVHLHHGDVALYSPGPNQGTTATVRLPVVAPVADPSRPPEPSVLVTATPARLGDVHVLVVEADPDDAALFEHVLTAQNARVTVATSATQAMAQAAETSPDVMVVDVSVMGKAGRDLLKRLRASAQVTIRETPVVAVSAGSNAKEANRYLAQGFDGHLAKPVDIMRLIDLVTALTHRR